jgi:capsular exopolysaccharide synthesis family protein
MLIPDSHLSRDAGRSGMRDALPAPFIEAPDESALGLRELVRLLLQRGLKIAAFCVVGALIGLGVATILPKSFYAEGLLVVDTQEINIPDFQTVTSQGTVQPWGARSAARVLVSREVVDKAVRKLDLLDDPEFNPALRPSILDRVLATGWVPDWLRNSPLLASVGTGALTSASKAEEARDRGKLVTSVLKHLTADSEDQSYAITLGFTGQDPAMVARIVNTVIDVFIAQELESKRHAMSEASRQLQSQTEEVRANLETARAKVLALESQPSVVTTGDGTVISQRLVTLAKEEQQIDNDEAGVRADLDQVGAALRGGRSNILNPDLVTPRLKVLLETGAYLGQTMAQTAIQLGPKHPRMQALAAEQTRVQQETTDEIRSIRDSLKERRATLDQRRAALQSDAQKLGQQAAVSADDRAKLEQLRADEQSQQQLYQTYRQRYRLTLANLQVIQPGIRVVSRPVPPVDPSSPGRALLTVAGGMVGALLAIAFILGRRWWKGGIDTPREVSLAAGVPALGGIPRFGGALFSPRAVWDPVVHRADGPITETMRGILYRIQHTQDLTPKVVMITSPSPLDGKTSLSLSLTRVAARDGLRTLCIETDFRRPALGARACVRPGWMLNDYLDGKATLEEAVVQDPASSAHLLVSRPVRSDPRRYLEHPRLPELFDMARAGYDLVIVDTAPVLRVIDPLLIAPLVDAVVVVISRGSATRNAVAETIERLRHSRTWIVGVVTTQLSGPVPAEYAYGGYAGR